MAWGPARGDLFHWRYESVDIAPHLRSGKNVLAAVVWNDGQHCDVAQISNRTAFLLQGDTEREQIVNAGPEWEALQNTAYQPIPITFEQVNGYVVIPPGERVDAARRTEIGKPTARTAIRQSARLRSRLTLPRSIYLEVSAPDIIGPMSYIERRKILSAGLVSLANFVIGDPPKVAAESRRSIFDAHLHIPSDNGENFLSSWRTWSAAG